MNKQFKHVKKGHFFFYSMATESTCKLYMKTEAISSNVARKPVIFNAVSIDGWPMSIESNEIITDAPEASVIIDFSRGTNDEL